MRYVHTAAVTSHAALTCSPRESASHANAPAPATATRSPPIHESNLPMRVPSLGFCCRQIGPSSQRNQPRAHRAGAAVSTAWLPLLYHSPTVTAASFVLRIAARSSALVLVAACARPAATQTPATNPSPAP